MNFGDMLNMIQEKDLDKSNLSFIRFARLQEWNTDEFLGMGCNDIDNFKEIKDNFLYFFKSESSHLVMTPTAQQLFSKNWVVSTFDKHLVSYYYRSHENIFNYLMKTCTIKEIEENTETLIGMVYSDSFDKIKDNSLPSYTTSINYILHNLSIDVYKESYDVEGSIPIHLELRVNLADDCDTFISAVRVIFDTSSEKFEKSLLVLFKRLYNALKQKTRKEIE